MRQQRDMAWHGGETQMCAATNTTTNSVSDPVRSVPDSLGRKERASEMRRGELSMTEETVDWETRVTMTGKGGFSMAGKWGFFRAGKCKLSMAWKREKHENMQIFYDVKTYISYAGKTRIVSSEKKWAGQVWTAHARKVSFLWRESYDTMIPHL